MRGAKNYQLPPIRSYCRRGNNSGALWRTGRSFVGTWIRKCDFGGGFIFISPALFCPASRMGMRREEGEAGSLEGGRKAELWCASRSPVGAGVCFVLRTDHDVVSRGDSYTGDTWQMRWAAGVWNMHGARPAAVPAHARRRPNGVRRATTLARMI
jgi:hypothetical protein